MISKWMKQTPLIGWACRPGDPEAVRLSLLQAQDASQTGPGI